jgi:hydroxymethylpyrimidine/phosphomethylpyrimidine kinase
MNTLQEPEKTEKAPAVIVAGGLDPSGGAGLAADIIAVQAAGVIPLPVATALTVQDSINAYGSYPVEPDIIEEQLSILLNDFRPSVMKLGLAGSAAAAERLAEFIGTYGIKLVFDPVIASSGGAILVDNVTRPLLAELLVPLAFLVTPNAQEAESLTGVRVTDETTAKEAAAELTAMGAQNVLVTGGHIAGQKGSAAIDYLYNGDTLTKFEAARIDRGETRGTGCHLSSSITAYLAKDYALAEAVGAGKEYVSAMIRRSATAGQGAAQAIGGT